jgi:hypothetical protein
MYFTVWGKALICTLNGVLVCFEKVPHYVAQAGLELRMWPRVTSNWQFSCFHHLVQRYRHAPPYPTSIGLLFLGLRFFNLPSMPSPGETCSASPKLSISPVECCAGVQKTLRFPVQMEQYVWSSRWLHVPKLKHNSMRWQWTPFWIFDLNVHHSAQ